MWLLAQGRGSRALLVGYGRYTSHEGHDGMEDQGRAVRIGCICVIMYPLPLHVALNSRSQYQEGEADILPCLSDISVTDNGRSVLYISEFWT